MAKVAVTGAAGFLGAHTVRACLDSGDTVRAVVRPGADLRSLKGLEFEVSEADLELGSVDAQVLKGVDAVIHLAAVYSSSASDFDLMRAVNVGGTAALLEAAGLAGVKRFVHCSTMGTCVNVHSSGPATENDRLDADTATPYHATKMAGELLALGRSDFETIVINPSAPVGAYDRKPSVTGQRVLAALNGQWPYLFTGQVNYIPARSCAQTLRRAVDHGRARERYLIGGKNISSEEFLALVAQGGQCPVAKRPLLWKLRGKGKPKDAALMIDDSKARSELSHDPGDLAEAFVEAAEWFRSEGRA